MVSHDHYFAFSYAVNHSRSMLLKLPDAYPVIHNVLHNSRLGPRGRVCSSWDTESMWLAQFMFTPGEYDDEFHRLNDAIDAFAESLEGFVGAERWLSPDGKTHNSMYYWRDRQSLGEFSRFPEHLVRKKELPTLVSLLPGGHQRSEHQLRR
jgi:hypothetical protein